MRSKPQRRYSIITISEMKDDMEMRFTLHIHIVMPEDPLQMHNVNTRCWVWTELGTTRGTLHSSKHWINLSLLQKIFLLTWITPNKLDRVVFKGLRSIKLHLSTWIELKLKQNLIFVWFQGGRHGKHYIHLTLLTLPWWQPLLVSLGTSKGD